MMQRLAHIPMFVLLAGCGGQCGAPMLDAGPHDAGASGVDGGASDAGATSGDAGALDAGPGGDASSPDAATSDSGAADSGPNDSGPNDSGPNDSGLGDAGPQVPPPCFIPGSTWPGPQTVVAVDDVGADIGNDASGLVWPPFGEDVLWLVENAPSRVHRLVVDDATGKRVHDLAWGSPRDLTFNGGDSAPDSEGVTVGLAGDSAIYVSSERDVSDGMVSRLSVLRYDTSSNDAPIDDHTEWDLTADLAAANIVVESNAGLEAITFIPDDVLQGVLFDHQAGALYDAATYPAHYGGVFAVGVEQTGDIAFYVLQQDGGLVRLALVSSGLGAIMALEADRISGTVWAACDSTCNNAYAVLSISGAGASSGEYVVRDVFFGPTGLPALDHEAFALGARTDEQRAVFWAADGAMPGEAVHEGAISAAAVCAGE